jgi:hypothetical protein
MIVFAVVATVISLVWSGVVCLANGMSTSSNDGFAGGNTVIAAWVATAALWLAWWVG